MTMILKTRYKYIHFDRVSFLSESWGIRNNKTGDRLGGVVYNRAWKQHVVRFNPDAIFSIDCLEDIQDFVKHLNDNVNIRS